MLCGLSTAQALVTPHMMDVGVRTPASQRQKSRRPVRWFLLEIHTPKFGAIYWREGT